MTRFGDLLQTQPVISGLERAGHDVGLVCLENFVGVATLLQGVSAVNALPGARLLAQLDRDWRGSVQELSRFRDTVMADFTPDVVLNLTPTLSVRLLSRLLATPSKNSPGAPLEGFGLDEQGYGRSANPWAAFLQSSSKNRGCSPFNLVDLFWKTAGLGDGPRPFALAPPFPEAEKGADEKLAPLDEQAPQRNGFVAFQLGASEDRRRWPAAHFAELGRLLWERDNLYPVLLGSKGEAPLAARYVESGAPGLSLVGNTSLTELAAVVKRAVLLVTNDTGTMHLAAGYDVPILAFFLATAQPWDTGPYQPGKLCLEPDMDCHPCQFGKPCPKEHACRGAISAAAAAELIRAYLGGAPLPAHNCGARVWETCRDADHSMILKAHSGHESTDRAKWITLQRHVYRNFLDHTPIPPLPDVADSLSPRARAEILAALADSVKLLTLLIGQAQALAASPREHLKNKFFSGWERLQGVWRDSEYFNVLNYLWESEAQESEQSIQAVQHHLARYMQLMQSWLSLVS